MESSFFCDFVRVRRPRSAVQISGLKDSKSIAMRNVKSEDVLLRLSSFSRHLHPSHLSQFSAAVKIPRFGFLFCPQLLF